MGFPPGYWTEKTSNWTLGEVVWIVTEPLLPGFQGLGDHAAAVTVPPPPPPPPPQLDVQGVDVGGSVGVGEGVGDGAGVSELGLGLASGALGAGHEATVLVGIAWLPESLPVPVSSEPPELLPLPLVALAIALVARVEATPTQAQSSTTVITAEMALKAARNWRSVSQRC